MCLRLLALLFVGTSGSDRAGFESTFLVSRRWIPSPEQCGLHGQEFCPYDESCVPEKGCGNCLGYTEQGHNHQCAPTVPAFVEDMCGAEVGRKCYKFSVGILSCFDYCETGYHNAFGNCMLDLRAGCPAPIAHSICNCDERGCDEPCRTKVELYSSCVNNGGGKDVTTSWGFMQYVEQCVFGHSPAANVPPISCSCAHQ